MTQDQRIILNPQYNRLEIYFPYSPALVDKARELPDREYKDLKRGRFWCCPATPYHALRAMQAFPNFHIAKSVKDLASEAEKMIEASSKKTGRNYKSLYPFQAASVDFIIKAGGRAIVASDMGTGKSAVTLTFMRVRADLIGSTIIVAPANVIYHWKAETEKWLDDSWDVEIVSTGKQPWPRARVLIMSYAIATNRYRDIKKHNPDLIVFDEFHYLKNHKTKRTRAALKYTISVPFILGLSGTPFLNRPIEMYNFLKLLDPTAWKSWISYVKKYCGGFKNEFGGWETGGSSNQSELAHRLKTTMVRFTKQEVLGQMPDLTRAILPVKVSLKEYKAVKKSDFNHVFQWLNAARQAAGQSKVKPAIEWAKNFLDSTDKKLVVYAHHRKVIVQLIDALIKYGVTSITGDTDQKERARRVELFQTKPKPRVMVISKAAGEGINLYAASDILFVERDWTPMWEEQVEARLHRIGQGNAVTAWYLAAQGTIDEYFAKLIDHKREDFKSIIGSDSIETLVKEELMEMMK